MTSDQPNARPDPAARPAKPKPTPDQLQRRRDLAAIHLAKKELGLSDDIYREALKAVCGVVTAKDLDAPNRRKFLAWLRGRGWTDTAQRPRNVDDPEKGPMLRKIWAFLAEAGRPWTYVDGMARRMFGIEKAQWCTPPQLHKIIAALFADAKRHGRRTA